MDRLSELPVESLAVGGSPFPPIADYGFLSDCETTALVAPSGNVEWLCLPRMDSPSVFGAILDRDAGGFRIGPADTTVPVARRYLPGTNVLETSWEEDGGWIIVRDVLLIGPWHHEDERSHTHRRAPTDYDADHVLLRTVRCVNGEVQVQLDCDPVFDYGRTRPEWAYTGEAYHEATATADGADVQLRLVSDMNLGIEGARVTARTLMKEGDVRFCALAWSEHDPPRDYDEAYRRLVWTAHHWQHWLDHGQFPDHPWRSHLQRSALTLKGLSYAPTGAMVAAATTSLPETPGGERNWDYRYAWIRDATFTLWGLYTLGFDWEANDFFNFVLDVTSSEHDLQICTASTASATSRRRGWTTSPATRTRARCGSATGPGTSSSTTSGAPSSTPPSSTRSRATTSPTGCGACSSARSSRRSSTGATPTAVCGRCAGSRATSPRRRPCAGLRPTAARAWPGCARTSIAPSAGAARRTRSTPTCAPTPSARGVFTQHYDTTALDASCLLLPLLRFLPPDDERIRATVLAIADELTENGLVLRYRVEETDDGMRGDEGTFTICSFWLVSALTEIGELDRARDLCERLLGFASPLGLYAEEIDARTGRHLGNFPQAFTHLALINAVMHVIRADSFADQRRGLVQARARERL